MKDGTENTRNHKNRMAFFTLAKDRSCDRSTYTEDQSNKHNRKIFHHVKIIILIVIIIIK